jgi:hypothetical protein
MTQKEIKKQIKAYEPLLKVALSDPEKPFKEKIRIINEIIKGEIRIREYWVRQYMAAMKDLVKVTNQIPDVRKKVKHKNNN